jgi:hypothetical protein
VRFEIAWRAGQPCPPLEHQCANCRAQRRTPEVELRNFLGRWSWVCRDAVTCVHRKLRAVPVPVPGHPHRRNLTRPL